MSMEQMRRQRLPEVRCLLEAAVAEAGLCLERGIPSGLPAHIDQEGNAWQVVSLQ